MEVVANDGARPHPCHGLEVDNPIGRTGRRELASDYLETVYRPPIEVKGLRRRGRAIEIALGKNERGDVRRDVNCHIEEVAPNEPVVRRIPRDGQVFSEVAAKKYDVVRRVARGVVSARQIAVEPAILEQRYIRAKVRSDLAVEVALDEVSVDIDVGACHRRGVIGSLKPDVLEDERVELVFPFGKCERRSRGRAAHKNGGAAGPDHPESSRATPGRRDRDVPVLSVTHEDRSVHSVPRQPVLVVDRPLYRCPSPEGAARNRLVLLSFNEVLQIGKARTDQVLEHAIGATADVPEVVPVPLEDGALGAVGHPPHHVILPPSLRLLENVVLLLRQVLLQDLPLRPLLGVPNLLAEHPLERLLGFVERPLYFRREGHQSCTQRRTRTARTLINSFLPSL